MTTPTHPNSMKCIVILSSKSSGSSACQALLSRFADVRCVAHTRHFENETLYWTKAASILGMPQSRMLDSEVPIPETQARRDLVQLLVDNIEHFEPPGNDRDLIFQGWQALCETYSPIFLEKSPHHLLQWSALELILECVAKLSKVDFFFIGLVRNPMDVLYSAYTRWKTPPEKLQYEWLDSYHNLSRFASLVGERIQVIRYEDMVHDPESLNLVLRFMHGDGNYHLPSDFFHERSINKWRKDHLYGFSLAPEVYELAREFGYTHGELHNKSYRLWPLQRTLARSAYKTFLPVAPLVEKLIR